LGGGVRATLTSADLLALPIALPPVEEQRRIADFLDDQVARIDTLAAFMNRYLSLIRERFEALRHSLVTGTSSNSVTVGPARTGLEWLEELPPGWRMVPLRTLFEFSKGRDAQRLTKDYVAAHPGEYPVFSGQTGSEGLFGRIDTFDFEVETGAILVTTVGASAMTTRVVAGRLSLSQNCALMAPRQSMPMHLVQFIEYQLRSIMEVRRSEIPDHMQPSLRLADLAGYRVALPPMELLTSISETLDVHRSRYHKALADRQRQIALLEERKASLIAAAVTGTLGIATAESVGVG
jgi:type I restriction enzyme S subunit